MLGCRVRCTYWESMVVVEERKLVLSTKFAPGSFSAAVLVKRMLSFFFFLLVDTHVYFQECGSISFLLPDRSSGRRLRSLLGDIFPPDFFHIA